MAAKYHLYSLCKESWVSLLLFEVVSNASKLRAEVIGGGIQAVLLDPTLVASPLHVLAAVNKAVLNREHEQMKTKNIFSEIIFCLSPSSNISDSFKKFGIKDTSSNLLVVLLHDSMDCNEQVTELTRKVSGSLVPFDKLKKFNNEDEIKKVFKITPEECEISCLEDSVVTRLTLKDIT